MRGKGRALSQRSAEAVVAALTIAVGALVAIEAARIGARWADDGPQTGYFPFYVASLLCVAGVFNFVRALTATGRAAEAVFVEEGPLRQILAVLVPSAVFAAVIPWLGLYLAAAAYIAYFMARLGGYALWKSLATGGGTGLVLFLLFEVWFLIPLPKGPLERALGVG